MRPQDRKLMMDATAASVAAVAVGAAALGPKACHQKGGAFSSLVEQCRGLRDDVPYEVQGLVEPVCDTLADGHWALTGIVAANVACYLPALANQGQWCVSKHELSHERLLRYQLAHRERNTYNGKYVDALLVVGSEVIRGRRRTGLQPVCSTCSLFGLRVGGRLSCAALLSNGASTVGAAGSVSGRDRAVSERRSPIQPFRSSATSRRRTPAVDAPRRYAGGGLVVRAERWSAAFRVAGPLSEGPRAA